MQCKININANYIKKHNESVRKSDRQENQTRDSDQREQTRLHAKKVNHGGYSCFEETDGKIQGATEKLAYGVI